MNESNTRRAVPNDTERLLQLIREFCEVDHHPWDEDFVRRALAPLLEDDRYGAVWVIGEPPQGYAVVTWSYSLESGGPDCLLDEFYLRERGRGLGSVALAVILDDLRRRGMTRIFLETEDHNEPVRRFYRRHGFRDEPSVWMSLDLRDN